MRRHLLLFYLAQAAFAASIAATGIERQGGQQAAAEFLFEVAVGGMFLKGLLCLGAEPANELLHLAAVLTLAGGIDQLVEAIDKGAVAPIRRSVASSKTAFPPQWAHGYSSLITKRRSDCERKTVAEEAEWTEAQPIPQRTVQTQPVGLGNPPYLT